MTSTGKGSSGERQASDVPPIALDAPAANPLPALEAELDSLLENLRGLRVEELSSGRHDAALCRVGEIRTELLRAEPPALPVTFRPTDATVLP